MLKRLGVVGIAIMSVVVLGSTATANAELVGKSHVTVLDHRIDIDSLHVSSVDAQIDSRFALAKGIDVNASVDVDLAITTTSELARKIAHHANTIDVASQTHHQFLDNIDPPLSHRHVACISANTRYSHLNSDVDAPNHSDIDHPSPLSRQNTASADLPNPAVTTSVNQFR